MAIDYDEYDSDGTVEQTMRKSLEDPVGLLVCHFMETGRCVHIVLSQAPGMRQVRSKIDEKVVGAHGTPEAVSPNIEGIMTSG